MAIYVSTHCRGRQHLLRPCPGQLSSAPPSSPPAGPSSAPRGPRGPQRCTASGAPTPHSPAAAAWQPQAETGTPAPIMCRWQMSANAGRLLLCCTKRKLERHKKSLGNCVHVKVSRWEVLPRRSLEAVPSAPSLALEHMMQATKARGGTFPITHQYTGTTTHMHPDEGSYPGSPLTCAADAANTGLLSALTHTQAPHQIRKSWCTSHANTP